MATEAPPSAPAPPRRPPAGAVLAVLAVLGLAAAVLAAVLAFGGGLPSAGQSAAADEFATAPGLILGTQLARLAAEVMAASTLGFLAVAALVLHDERAGTTLDDGQRRCLRPAAVSAALWAAASVLWLPLSLAEGFGQPLTSALDPTVLASYLGQTSVGRALLVTGLAASAVAALAPGTRGITGVRALFGLALLGAVTPSLTGHAGMEHEYGAMSVAVHVGAVGVWAGGLFAVLVLARSAGNVAARALPSFGRLALGCYVAVAVTGVVNATVRVTSWSELFTSGYGLVVLLKVALLVVLGGFGWLQRRALAASLPSRGTGATFRRVAALEVTVLLVTFAVAVALARTPPPA